MKTPDQTENAASNTLSLGSTFPYGLFVYLVSSFIVCALAGGGLMWAATFGQLPFWTATVQTFWFLLKFVGWVFVLLIGAVWHQKHKVQRRSTREAP